MAWVVPLYDREQVNIAGRTRINDTASADAKESALGIVNNWRSAHSFPLNCFQVTLRDRAHSINPGALIAQRLKRLVAIEAKLRRFSAMKLSQMQDIGGCRAILTNVGQVERLANLYRRRSRQDARRAEERAARRTPNGNTRAGHQLVHEDDYIATPKGDGYRGIHLIYRYHTGTKAYRAFNDLKVEIQLRSRLQHAWATAVETVDVFTGQALKSDQGQKDGRGSLPSWEVRSLLKSTVHRSPMCPRTEPN